MIPYFENENGTASCPRGKIYFGGLFSLCPVRWYEHRTGFFYPKAESVLFSSFYSLFPMATTAKGEFAPTAIAKLFLTAIAEYEPLTKPVVEI